MLLAGPAVWAADPPAKAVVRKLPHLEIDVAAKTVRVECEAVNAEAALEFFLCAAGTQEHETVLRSAVKASHLHQALLMIGLQPGEPVRYVKSTNKWLPPQGPPLQITAEFERDGKNMSVPAYRLMRNVKTKKEMPALTWVFTGSRLMDDGKYAADVTGYLISVVNFDLTVIDIPELASSANETLEWEINPDTIPKQGAKVWLVIEPAGKVQAPHGDNPRQSDAEPASPPAQVGGGNDQPVLSPVKVDEQRIQELRRHWEKLVAPHAGALRQAAQTHYDVINALRREQQRLIDEADRIQRVIDELQRDYQDMTTPRPAPPQ